MHDILVRRGHVVDPENVVDHVADVAIRGGRVEDVGPDLSSTARLTLDATGCYVFPGLVDLHVHVDTARGSAGPAMLARAGVTTALDLGGRVEGVLATALSSRVGINLATLEVLRPGHQLPERPTAGAIRAAIDRVLDAGGLGIKLHVDAAWDPDTAGRIIAECHARQAWIAIHCGTTTAGSTIEGMRQTIELAGPLSVHIAHVNSYCRGEIDDPVEEARTAIDLLRSAPHHFAESYLAAMNGNSAECVDGLPRPRVAQWLIGGGYPGTQEGLRKAIKERWAQIPVPRGEDVVYVTGEEGVAWWEQAGTRTLLGLPVNPASSRIALASSRAAHGHFDVPALATDGGAFPRNVTVRSGLALVDLGVLTVPQLVEKACRVPAHALGLADKGHLGPGSDADVAIVDGRTHAVVTTIASGEVVMHRNLLTRTGTRFLTTDRGASSVRATGLRADLLELGQSWLYPRSSRRAQREDELP